jgi:hypothetical protein
MVSHNLRARAHTYTYTRARRYRHWHRQPAFCGNGGFSLRRRVFVTTILNTMQWVSQRVSGNEDWFICSAAADIYPLLLARHDPRLIAAPREDALAFSVEMLYHEKPFGVHQFWSTLLPPNETALCTLLENCPESLSILPENIVSRRPDWRAVLCDVAPALAGCIVPKRSSSSSTSSGGVGGGGGGDATTTINWAHIKGTGKGKGTGKQQLLGRRRRQEAMRRKI